MLYLFFSLPKNFSSCVDKTYHWFVITDQQYSRSGSGSYSHFCSLNLKSKSELNRYLCSSLAICDGLFLTKNIASTLTLNPSQSICLQKDFIFVPTRYKNKFDLFTLDARPFISDICNCLNLQ